MCLILLSWKQHPRFPLVFAANRDEFYERPSRSASFWEDHPQILGGRDLKDGGTWCGMTRTGRFAALTNYRDPASLRAGVPSRGLLVRRFLESSSPPAAFVAGLAAGGEDYNGYSLLAGDLSDLWVVSNRGEPVCLPPGLFGLSNHLLDTPWPKVERGKGLLAEAMDGMGKADPERIFRLLGDRIRPADDRLPDTGVGRAWERILAPIFIESPVYGTRCSTVLFVDGEGRAIFNERVYDGSATKLTSRFDFPLEPLPGGREGGHAWPYANRDQSSDGS